MMKSRREQRPARGKAIRSAGKKTVPAQTGRLHAGMVVTLPVSKKTDFGYFLKDDDVEILLHQNEATGAPLHVGDEVEVFLYHDHENRLAATMEMPLVEMGEYGWLEVVDVSPRMGVFLHNGIQKDLLLFVDDLPKWHEEWPRVGDRLLVTLKRDKHGRLLAKPVTEQEIEKIAVPAGPEMRNRWVEGTVYKVIQAGAFLLTEDEQILFVHRDEMTERLRLGQTVRCRVSFVREDGRLNGSMRERKEVQYSADAERILRYLVERGGAMPYSDDTPAEIIREKFAMSKSSFKRALGKLLKEQKIEQEEGWTHLKREELQRYREQEKEADF